MHCIVGIFDEIYSNLLAIMLPVSCRKNTIKCLAVQETQLAID